MSQNGISWINDEIAALKSAGLYNVIRTIDSPMDAWVTIDGRRVLNFCANNYLGLANHPACARRPNRASTSTGLVPARCAPLPAP